MSLLLIITNAGRAALLNAQQNGTAPVIIASCGVSPTALNPTVLATELPGEVKRIGTLSGVVPDADTIHVTVRDESLDAFTLRSIGLYLDDGTLFGIYGQTAVILEKTAQSAMLLQVDVKFANINATDINFGDANFLNPPATEAMKGVAEIATQAETDAGTDDTRIVTPKKLAARLLSFLTSWGFDIVRFSNDGAGSTLDADLLDGQQGVWYTDIAGRLGFMPAKRAGDTFSGHVIASNGTASARLSIDGTVMSATTATTGLFAFGTSGTKTLQFDGTNFHFTGGSLYVGGALVYTAATDGAGSGSDADLLDGQQGSWYTDISARLGYVPLNAATYTASDILAKLLTVDGAGSTVDADLLDGQHGSYYADIAGRLGFTPLNAASYTASDVLAKLLSVDGAGSMIDTDLWRGLAPQQFIDGQFTRGANTNGKWRRYPVGGGEFEIEQRGLASFVPTGSSTLELHIDFPIAFTDLESINIVGNGDDMASSNWGALTTVFRQRTLTGCTIRIDSGRETQPIWNPIKVNWRAVGN